MRPRCRATTSGVAAICCPSKKPKDLVEYVVVHEMLHLIEPTHSERFMALISRHYPAWREARAELNELPLGAAAWRV
jgi:predicted metal-dependent hydrolase